MLDLEEGEDRLADDFSSGDCCGWCRPVSGCTGAGMMGDGAGAGDGILGESDGIRWANEGIHSSC